MLKLIKKVSQEKRKVRWATTSQTTKIFFASLFTIFVFVVVIWLFSFGITQLEGLAK